MESDESDSSLTEIIKQVQQYPSRQRAAAATLQTPQHENGVPLAHSAAQIGGSEETSARFQSVVFDSGVLSSVATSAADRGVTTLDTRNIVVGPRHRVATDRLSQHAAGRSGRRARDDGDSDLRALDDARNRKIRVLQSTGMTRKEAEDASRREYQVQASMAALQSDVTIDCTSSDTSKPRYAPGGVISVDELLHAAVDVTRPTIIAASCALRATHSQFTPLLRAAPAAAGASSMLKRDRHDSDLRGCGVSFTSSAVWPSSTGFARATAPQSTVALLASPPIIVDDCVAPPEVSPLLLRYRGSRLFRSALLDHAMRSPLRGRSPQRRIGPRDNDLSQDIDLQRGRDVARSAALEPGTPVRGSAVEAPIATPQRAPSATSTAAMLAAKLQRYDAGSVWRRGVRRLRQRLHLPRGSAPTVVGDAHIASRALQSSSAAAEVGDGATSRPAPSASAVWRTPRGESILALAATIGVGAGYGASVPLAGASRGSGPWPPRWPSSFSDAVGAANRASIASWNAAASRASPMEVPVVRTRMFMIAAREAVASADAASGPNLPPPLAYPDTPAAVRAVSGVSHGAAPFGVFTVPLEPWRHVADVAQQLARVIGVHAVVLAKPPQTEVAALQRLLNNADNNTVGERNVFASSQSPVACQSEAACGDMFCVCALPLSEVRAAAASGVARSTNDSVGSCSDGSENAEGDASASDGGDVEPGSTAPAYYYRRRALLRVAEVACGLLAHPVANLGAECTLASDALSTAFPGDGARSPQHVNHVQQTRKLTRDGARAVSDKLAPQPGAASVDVEPSLHTGAPATEYVRIPRLLRARDVSQHAFAEQYVASNALDVASAARLALTGLIATISDVLAWRELAEAACDEEEDGNDDSVDSDDDAGRPSRPGATSAIVASWRDSGPGCASSAVSALSTGPDGSWMVELAARIVACGIDGPLRDTSSQQPQDVALTALSAVRLGSADAPPLIASSPSTLGTWLAGQRDLAVGARVAMWVPVSNPLASTAVNSFDDDASEGSNSDNFDDVPCCWRGATIVGYSPLVGVDPSDANAAVGRHRVQLHKNDSPTPTDPAEAVVLSKFAMLPWDAVFVEQGERGGKLRPLADAYLTALLSRCRRMPADAFQHTPAAGALATVTAALFRPALSCSGDGSLGPRLYISYVAREAELGNTLAPYFYVPAAPGTRTPLGALARRIAFLGARAVLYSGDSIKARELQRRLHDIEHAYMQRFRRQLQVSRRSREALGAAEIASGRQRDIRDSFYRGEVAVANRATCAGARAVPVKADVTSDASASDDRNDADGAGDDDGTATRLAFDADCERSRALQPAGTATAVRSASAVNGIVPLLPRAFLRTAGQRHDDLVIAPVGTEQVGAICLTVANRIARLPRAGRPSLDFFLRPGGLGDWCGAVASLVGDVPIWPDRSAGGVHHGDLSLAAEATHWHRLEVLARLLDLAVVALWTPSAAPLPPPSMAPDTHKVARSGYDTWGCVWRHDLGIVGRSVTSSAATSTGTANGSATSSRSGVGTTSVEYVVSLHEDAGFHPYMFTGVDGDALPPYPLPSAVRPSTAWATQLLDGPLADWKAAGSRREQSDPHVAAALAAMASVVSRVRCLVRDRDDR